MGEVDHSDALIGYYNVLHKTKKWYRTFFFHFVDIAVVNAFILHQDLVNTKNQKPMSQKAFRETLILELAGLATKKNVPDTPPRPSCGCHSPVHITKDSTAGRHKCKVCCRNSSVMCHSCNVAFCYQMYGNDQTDLVHFMVKGGYQVSLWHLQVAFLERCLDMH